MNRRFFNAVFAMILTFCMIHFTGSVFAEDKTEPVYVNASETNQSVVVGNVDAEHFGVHVRAENGHTAFVNAENVRARYVENLPNAALYIFASGSGSLADIHTKDLTAEEETDNFGANIRVSNGGRAIVSARNVSGDTGIEIYAEGKDSSVKANTGNLNINQYGVKFQSSDYAEIEVTTGNIHAAADGIFNPSYPMAEKGGKVRINAQDVISDNDFGVGGYISDTDSELTLKTRDISAEYVGMDLSTENGGKVYAETGNVTINSKDTGPYAPFYTRRSAGGHSRGAVSDLEFRISGSISLTEIGNNSMENLNQQPSEGVLATSSDGGNTVINIEKGVAVKAEKTQTVVSGIRAENSGGTVIVSAGSDVSAEVPNSQKAYGLYIINNASNAIGNLFPIDSAQDDRYPINTQIDPYQKTVTDSRTEIFIHGDLSGSAYGLNLEQSSDSDMTADVVVTGTIFGGNAGVLVSENTTPDNFRLTVWNIIPNSEGCAAVNTNGSCAEEIEAEIRYIIKVTGSQNNYRLTDQYGNSLEISHGFPVAKAGETVCLHTAASYYDTGLTDGNDGNCQIVSKSGAVSFTVDSVPAVDFYRILNNEGKLPATGFSTQSASQLPLRPEGLVYGNTGLMLQIPFLDVMEPIVTVPKTDGSYPVEWLGSDIGLLEGTALPGEGFSVLTGHNHLNTTEAGPFVFLSTLKENDLIMIADNEGNPRIFHVEGNHLISPDELNTLADKLTENTLLLVTCEDESISGEYLHRRVIFALPE